MDVSRLLPSGGCEDQCVREAICLERKRYTVLVVVAALFLGLLAGVIGCILVLDRYSNNVTDVISSAQYVIDDALLPSFNACLLENQANRVLKQGDVKLWKTAAWFTSRETQQYFSLDADRTRVIIKSPGIYRLSAQVLFRENSRYQHVAAALSVNGQQVDTCVQTLPLKHEFNGSCIVDCLHEMPPTECRNFAMATCLMDVIVRLSEGEYITVFLYAGNMVNIHYDRTFFMIDKRV